MIPSPHGIVAGFRLTQNECQQYKVLDLFHVLPVERWGDLDKVIDEQLKSPMTIHDEPRTAKQRVQKSLVLIGKKRADNYPLRIFCERLNVYYKSKPVSNTFTAIWAEKQQLAQEVTRAVSAVINNSVKISTLNALKSGNELERLIIEASSASSTQQHQDKSAMEASGETDELVPFYLNLKESDEYDFQGSTIGTRIKHEALRIFESWKNGAELTDREQYWMKCGLSSILDLVNTKSTQEFLGCNDHERCHVESKFIQRHQITPSSLPTLFDQTYGIVAALLQKHNNTTKATEYVHLVKTPSSRSKKMLNVILTVMHILESNAFLLDPENSKRATEYDFITQIWSPLLKSIVDINGILRLKIGESSPSQGNISRKRVYENTNVGFKVDIRIMYDSRHNEHDLLALEAAKDGTSSKMDTDLSKLFREAKDNFDNCIQHLLLDKKAHPSSWFVQANGNQARLGSIHLTEPGLYAAIHQGMIRCPRNLTSFGNFKYSLSLLFTMVSDLERNAHMIRTTIDCIDDRNNSIGNSINRQDLYFTGSQLSNVTRPTYYDPPTDDVKLARLPSHLFGSLYERSAPCSPCGSRSPSHDCADSCGWMKKDDKFVNALTGATADEHPFY